jgi:hypothetical protein
MTIYQSTKSAPYVYMCVHKDTNKFYIGYRYNNVKTNTTSDQDFPNYKTSSKKIKPIFEMFNWCIIAEFFNEDDAYDFEQQLINEHWDNPLLINSSCHFRHKRFKKDKDYVVSAETRAKLSAANKGKIVSAETRAKLSAASSNENNAMYGKPSPFKGRHHSEETKTKLREAAKTRVVSDETRKKLAIAGKGKVISDYQRMRIKESNSTRIISDETKRKMSESAKGRIPWNKGLKRN